MKTIEIGFYSGNKFKVKYSDGSSELLKLGLHIISGGRLYPSPQEKELGSLKAELNSYGIDSSVLTKHYIYVESDYNSDTNVYSLIVHFQEVSSEKQKLGMFDSGDGEVYFFSEIKINLYE